MDNYRLGIFYGLGAYLLWGVLPIYWKLLQHVERWKFWRAVFYGQPFSSFSCYWQQAS